MRRGGIGAFQAQQQRQAALQQTGAVLKEELLAAMRKQLRVFQANLETYAREHGKDIQNNSELRAKFHKMCANLGVDPLTSSKDMWSTLGMGAFYFELAVRVVEITLATRALNGGIMDVDELMRRLRLRRITYTEDITIDDIEKAVKKLRVFGSAFALVKLDRKQVLRSVPVELEKDHTLVFQAVESTGHGSKTDLTKQLKWSGPRLEKALGFLMENQMVWVDDQGPEREYYFLGLVKNALG